MSDAPNDYWKPEVVTLCWSPEQSEWKCELAGGPNGLVLFPAKGQVPNAFHRFMQNLCFGFRWVRK